MAEEKPIELETFAHKLKHLREQHGITMEKMSQKLGFAKSTIHAWENGHRKPKSWDTVQMIAKYFGVSNDYFYDDQSMRYALKDILKRLEILEEKVIIKNHEE